MRLIIKATNFTLTPPLERFIQKKIGNELSELLAPKFQNSKTGKDILEAKIEVARTTMHHKKGDIFRAEVNIPLPGGKTLRVEAEEWDVYVAIDKVRDGLFLEINKWKQKKLANVRKGGRKFKEALKRMK